MPKNTTPSDDDSTFGVPQKAILRELHDRDIVFEAIYKVMKPTKNWWKLEHVSNTLGITEPIMGVIYLHGSFTPSVSNKFRIRVYHEPEI